jgi:hypothetical protein
MLQILAEALLLATRQSGAIHRQPTQHDAKARRA